jgi:hypothetical protein
MSTPEDQLASAQRVDVSLRRSATLPTIDQPLWSAIRNRTDAISFNRYFAFINRLLEEFGDDTNTGGARSAKAAAKKAEHGEALVAEQLSNYARRPLIYGADAYYVLKFATQAFIALESGVLVKPEPPLDDDDVVPGEESRLGEEVTFEDLQTQLTAYLQQEVGGIKGNVLPYLKRVVSALLGSGVQADSLPQYGTILRRRLVSPSLLELIWCYWHEEGMLVQTMNTIAMRFQNRRQGASDPLGNLELDPLRPLNNLLWGFIQDEVHRLSVARRAHEYHHHYGLSMYGKAVANVDPADDRSRFVAAFHNLLHRAVEFYRDDADTTLISDGFPLLNSLKELHVILAEGAHNQYGDMPTVARSEMLIMQWLLARPELREFLGGRPMVPYREPWMRQVDTMKRIKGWTDVSVNHFRDLGTFGEKLLLSVRYGDWIDVNDQEQARNWARYWKPEVQSYVHSYLAATGVDLTAVDVSDARRTAERNLQPSVHLRNRLADQQSRNVRAITAQAPMTQELSIAPARLRSRLLSRTPRE